MTDPRAALASIAALTADAAAAVRAADAEWSERFAFTFSNGGDWPHPVNAVRDRRRLLAALDAARKIADAGLAASDGLREALDAYLAIADDIPDSKPDDMDTVEWDGWVAALTATRELLDAALAPETSDD